MKKILLYILSTIFIINLSGALALASAPTIPKPDFLPGQSETEDDVQDYVLNKGLQQAINIAIGLVGIGAFIGIIIGSIHMLTAYGVEDKIKKGKDLIRYSVIGLVFVILSYAIVSIVVSISFPSEEDEETSWIPSAYAVDTEKDLDTLFPSEKTLIEDRQTGDSEDNVSLPGGDFLEEVVPAAITNVFYLTGILIFISITVGGVYLVIGRGNEELTTKAKQILIYSLVAVVLLSLGYAIIYGILTLNLENETNEESDDIFVNESDE